MSSKHPYFSPSKPRVLAHRGLATAPSVDENTFLAFEAAVAAGVSYIESDIQVTRDGIPVLFHDDDLSRVAGVSKRIDQISLLELSQISLVGGGQVPTLEQTLIRFSETLFNLDVKAWGAIKPAMEVINRLEVHDRVLVSAFSEIRRRAALRLLTSPVASSAGSGLVISLYLTSLLRLTGLMKALAKSANALQVPVRLGPLRFDSPRFISNAHNAGLEIHFWTINEVCEMERLISLGADALVTDRADLALELLKNRL